MLGWVLGGAAVAGLTAAGAPSAVITAVDVFFPGVGDAPDDVRDAKNGLEALSRVRSRELTEAPGGQLVPKTRPNEPLPNHFDETLSAAQRAFDRNVVKVGKMNVPSQTLEKQVIRTFERDVIAPAARHAKNFHGTRAEFEARYGGGKIDAHLRRSLNNDTSDESVQRFVEKIRPELKDRFDEVAFAVPVNGVRIKPSLRSLTPKLLNEIETQVDNIKDLDASNLTVIPGTRTVTLNVVAEPNWWQKVMGAPALSQEQVTDLNMAVHNINTVAKVSLQPKAVNGSDAPLYLPPPRDSKGSPLKTTTTEAVRNVENNRPADVGGGGDIGGGGRGGRKPPVGGDRPPDESNGSARPQSANGATGDGFTAPDDGSPVTLPPPSGIAAQNLNRRSLNALTVNLPTEGPFAGVVTPQDAQERIRELIDSGRLVELGSGASNTAYRLLDEHGKSTGKIVRVPKSEDGRNLSPREFEVTRDMSDSGVTPVLFEKESFVAPSEKSPFLYGILVQNEVHGEPLKNVIGVGGRPVAKQRILNPQSKVEYAESFIESVAQIHRRGIAHGDLNEGNIILERPKINVFGQEDDRVWIVSPEHRAKVIDFGSATAEQQSSFKFGLENDLGELLDAVKRLKPESVSKSEWRAWFEASYLKALEDPNTPGNAELMSFARDFFRNNP
jgi:tRNA A-37 threonylcarbamoyl transferase component Bud32